MKSRPFSEDPRSKKSLDLESLENMRPLPMRFFLFLALLFPGISFSNENSFEAGKWPIDRLQAEVPSYRVEDEKAKIQSLVYEGEPVDGKPTEVFAFFASPRTLGILAEGENVPGIVLIHGGGGTAFSDWVWMWAKRGYAAIAMDLSGHRPPEPRYDESGKKIADAHHPKDQRIRLPKGGLNQTHAEKFQSIGGPIDDDWPYHAVCNVMKAHTLLRSFPEVEASLTAVTGISWGGYTTCLAASLDDRFSAAVPVYGCGFLHVGESVQKPSIDALGERKDLWVQAYDPSSHLSKCTVPMLWVNGTHDKHYVLDSYAKSYRLVSSAQTFRIEPRMRHSHQAGWAPDEIQIFMDSLLKNGKPLPELGKLQTWKDQTVAVDYTSAVPLAEAQLHFTREAGIRTGRNWESRPAKMEENRILAEGLPKDANTFFITVTDERGAMVSSGVGFQPALP